MWARIDCDLRELVVAQMGRVLAAARIISRELRELADSTGLRVLAVELDRAFGLADPMAAAKFMADDMTTPSRVGWAAALSRWSRRGRLPATPSPGSWALYLDTLGAGRFPDFRPTDDDPAIWDCHPYVGAPPRTRVVAVVGDAAGRQYVTRAIHESDPSRPPRGLPKTRWDVCQLALDAVWTDTGATIVVEVPVVTTLFDALDVVAALPIPATSVVLAGYPEAVVHGGRVVDPGPRTAVTLRRQLGGTLYAPEGAPGASARPRRFVASSQGITFRGFAAVDLPPTQAPIIPRRTVNRPRWSG